MDTPFPISANSNCELTFAKKPSKHGTSDGALTVKAKSPHDVGVLVTNPIISNGSKLDAIANQQEGKEKKVSLGSSSKESV